MNSKFLFLPLLCSSLSMIACIESPEDGVLRPVSMDGGQIVGPPVHPDSFPVDVRILRESSPEHIFALSDGSLLTQTGTTVAYMSTLKSEWEIFDFSFSEILAAEALPWDAVLFWMSDGFYVWSDGEVHWSPLSEIVPATQSGQLLVTPGPEGKKDLWIASDDGLRLWRDDRAYTIRSDSLSTRSAKLAFGAPWQGQAALWVASGDTVYALVLTATVTRAHESLTGFPVSQIEVDFEGTVWVLSEERILSRGWANQWTEHTGLGKIAAIAGHNDSTQLWIRTSDDGIWSHRSGAFQPISWKDEAISLSEVTTSTMSFLGLPQGQVLLQTSEAVYIMTPGRFVDILGLHEGQLLTSTVTIDIQLSEPETVASIRAFLDGTELEPAGKNTRFLVSPVGLFDGTHLVRVDVSYTDGAPSTHLERRFSVYREMLPRWSDTVYPLFQAKCEVCHGIRGSARLLNTPQLWRTDIDRILNAVRSGIMPLPPSPRLSDFEIEKIEGWRAVGYLE